MNTKEPRALRSPVALALSLAASVIGAEMLGSAGMGDLLRDFNRSGPCKRTSATKERNRARNAAAQKAAKRRKR